MRLFSCALIALLTASIASSAQDLPTLTDGYYVVVSAYRPQQAERARALAASLETKGMPASVGLDSKRNYCYVYLQKFDDFSESLREMEKTRASSGYADAWVRVMRGAVSAAPAETVTTVAAPASAAAPAPVKPDATVYIAIPKEAVAAASSSASASEGTQPVEARQLLATTAPSIATEVIENPPPDPVFKPQTLSNTPIFLSLFNARNHKVVNGEIEVIDTERARSMMKVQGNTYINLPDPKSKSGELTLICNAFGYRKVQHQIHYKNTEADTLKSHVDLVGNFYLVKFDLVRLHKGDISVLYNVYFYNDAAIMMPESKPELNSLLDLLEENPSYKIRLHGHTNGNAAGPIISRGPSGDFFTLAADVKKGYGSAKELSGERAAVIREWLLAQGISPERIDTKAWGGGRMLHDKHSVHAKRNVRVEVEVIEE
jgi:outer membrane protein OmpA-like peptidoglycan-associated protein